MTAQPPPQPGAGDPEDLGVNEWRKWALTAGAQEIPPLPTVEIILELHKLYDRYKNSSGGYQEVTEKYQAVASLAVETLPSLLEAADRCHAMEAEIAGLKAQRDAHPVIADLYQRLAGANQWAMGLESERDDLREQLKLATRQRDAAQALLAGMLVERSKAQEDEAAINPDLDWMVERTKKKYKQALDGLANSD
jgi:hypothetical protein